MDRFNLAALLAAVIVFAPVPPGDVVQRQGADLDGHATNSWRTVITKKAVGSADKETFYQWYVSIYQLQGGTYRLRYQSPGNGGPLDAVEKAKGASLWFPRQEASIVGSASLMGENDEQLVVESHQSGADCGSADLTVFRFDGNSGKIVPAVTIQNGCELKAKIVKSNGASHLELSGPYYNASAPMCCPTKPKATATLKFANGKWTETPNYYKFYPNSFPHV